MATGCAAGWLLLSVMVLMQTMWVSSIPPPITPSAADDKGGRGRKEAGPPAGRIGPIANRSPLDVKGGSNSDAAVAANFLVQFGYHNRRKPLDFLDTLPEGNDPSQSEDPQTKAIRLFQNYFGLEPTGKLDHPTLGLMKKERCGVADIPEEEEGASHVTGANSHQSPSQFQLLGKTWNKNELTWRLDTRSTNQLRPSTQRQVMTEAFETWRKVTPLEFRERTDRENSVDIDIKFGSGHHGDSYPFDGKGKVLAHAFGPGQAGEGGIDGDMHFDDQEDWSPAEKAISTSDLYLVATHELGHSLGLAHSRDPGALMYPYYGLTDRLGPDDIKAIQSLYGIRYGKPTTPKPVTSRPRPTTTTTTTRRPITRYPHTRRPTGTERPRPQTTTTTTTTTTEMAKECGVQFDVVIQDPKHDGLYNGIQGDKIYLFNAGGVLHGYPAPLNSVYPQAPSYAETVFTIPEREATYFVKDNRVWRYTGSRLDRDYPKDLNPTHFPEVIRFVLPIVDSAGHRRIFAFGRTLWWEYDFDDLPTASNYRVRRNLIPQYWPAISNDVKYAVMGSDKYIYLICSHGHVVLDSFRRALYGGKQEGLPQWIMPACRMRQDLSGSASAVNVTLTWYGAALINLLLLLFTKC